MSFDLQILFASDLEGGDTSTLDRAVDFAAIIDALDDGALATLVLSAGDNVIPGPFFNAGNDSAAMRYGGALNDAYNALFSTTAYDSLREAPGVVDVAIMNAIGFDASALGNHEFDAGTSTLADLIAADARGADGPAGDRYVGTLFPYLSANLDFSGDYGLNSLFSSAPVDATSNGGANTIAPMATFTMEGGEKVAVIGATTPILSTISSPGAVVANGGAGLASYPQNAAQSESVTDALAAELQPVIDQAVASGINKVVLVSHLQQISLEQSLVGKLSGVDVIIAGGSGTDAIDDSAAISFTNADGNPAYVVSVPGSYQTVGRLNLRFDDQGVPSLISSEGIDATAEEVARVGGDVSTGSAAIVQGLVDAVQGVVFTKDQDIKGFTDVYLEGNRGSIRTEETNFGNLAADSQLWYARQQDPTIQVSLKNGGGLRAAIGEVGGTAENPTFVAPSAKTVSTDGYDKPAGGISQLDLENTLKFNNNLVRVDTDAAGLRSLIEHAISASAAGNTPGQFPQVAGMRFSFDHSADFSHEAGQQRLQSLVIVDDAGAITDVIVQDGELVGDANRPVSMVTLGFLANNDGDSYPFSTVAHAITDITDGSGNKIYEQDALGDYLTTFHGTPDTAFAVAETAADQDQRIINIGAGNQNNVPLAIEAGVQTAINPTGSLDIGSPAEIGAYSAEHRVALATTGGDELALIDLTDFSTPALITRVQLSGALQSVDVSGDLVAVAVDGGGDNVPGLVTFLSLSGVGASASLTEEGSVPVGALPDSLKFNGDGTKLVVANEAQSIDIADPVNNDAQGSISVIDTSSFATTGVTTGFSVDTIDFTGFNGMAEKLNLQGIRINRNAGSVAQDIEPEFVAVLGDRAWVSLQENNAIAEIDLTDNSLTDVWSLGIKDWKRGTPEANNLPFEITYPGARPDANGNGTVDPGEAVAGGLSGAWYNGMEAGRDTFYVVTDRGPQAFDIGDRAGDNPSDPNFGEKVFDDPDYPITVYKLAQDENGLEQLESIQLKVPDENGGFRLSTGIGALAHHDKAFTATGTDSNGFTIYTEVARDAFGLDAESINVVTIAGLNGGQPMFAISDEYFPQIAFFDQASGELVKRIVPADTDFSGVSFESGRGDVASYTQATLPDHYSDRRNNRGFEGLAFNSDDGLFYAFIQSPMRPADYKNGSGEFIRVLAIDPLSGEPQAEYLHALTDESGMDKIGDAVYDASTGRFLVIERDSQVSTKANKSILEVDFSGATNVLALTTGTASGEFGTGVSSWADLIGVAQPEAHPTSTSVVDDLAAHGIYFAHRVELLNIPSTGADYRFDKPEGLALKPDGSVVVFNDNDFVNVVGRPDNVATEISFTPQPTDTSNRNEAGGVYGVKDLYGIKMPDGIAAFESDGETFIITTNEGDDRDGDGDLNEAFRVEDLEVDFGASLANQAALQAELGDRLKLVTTEGDYNRDGNIDQAYAFGGRSFSIYDDAGNLVFDSGNQLDEIAKAAGIYDDGRSDDKGMEPEMVTTQVIDGSTFAFVAMERADRSAIAMYDITDPANSRFVRLLTNPTPNAGAADGSGADAWGPEGLVFIPTQANGAGVLMATNEGDDFPLYEGQIDLYNVLLDENRRLIGETTALIPEASAADEPHELIDGSSGDVDFPFGNFKALATVGEVDPHTGKALTGYPDGQAAWLVDHDTVRVAYQSESYATMGAYGETYGWEMASGVEFTGSHIHTIDYDRAGFASFMESNDSGADIFKTSGNLFDTVYNVFGEVVDGKNSDPTDLSAKWGNQTKPDGTLIEFKSDYQLSEADFFFQSFCGAYYEQANKYGTGIGFADDVWLTAEEWAIGRMFAGGGADADSTMGLASVVVDIANETAYTVPALGQTGYEKLMPINSQSEDHVVIVAAGYNHDEDPAPLKIYVGRKDMDADGNPIDYSSANERDSFLGRNGLLHGQLYGLAIDAATQTDLALTKDYTGQMMEEYLQNASAPDTFSGRYYPTSYKWDGFDTPEAVENTEMHLWSQPSEQPTGYSFFNGDKKTEHPAADPDITKTRYIQNMTDKGGLMGFDFSNIAAEIVANDADGNGLPDFLSVDAIRIAAAVDGSFPVETGGKGKSALADKLELADLVDSFGQYESGPTHNSITSQAEFEALIDVYAFSIDEDATFTTGAAVDAAAGPGVTADVAGEIFTWNVSGHGANALAGTGPHATRDGSGLAFTAAELSDMQGLYDASLHIEKGTEKLVANDGLQWIKSADHDLLIIDEDSGNDFGERKLAVRIDPADMSMEQGFGYFLAQAGGSENPRTQAGVSAIGGTHGYATSSEFSGTWNVTPLVATKEDGSFYSPAEIAGTGYQQISELFDTDEQTFIGVVQHRSESEGIVAANKADAGGQVFMMTLDLPATIGETTALVPEASAADEPHELLDGQSGDTDYPFADFKALATIGEIDPQSGKALTGWPDGNAAWLVDDTTIRIAYQSESYANLYGSETYPMEMANGVTFTGSHIHTIDYDRQGFADFLTSDASGADIFKTSGQLFDTIYNVFGEVVDGKNADPSDLSAKWGNQTKADGTYVDSLQLTEADFHMHSLCGAWYENAHKYGAGIGFEDDVWLAAEEWQIGGNDTMGLASIVVDIDNETAYTVPALGQTGYEKLLPLNPGHEDYVMVVAAGYNHGTDPAPLKVYVGMKDMDANGNPIDYNTASERDAFLGRNGLLHGQLYGLAIDAATQADLSISKDYTEQMMEEYLQDASAPDHFSARYYPTSYKWDGFDSPEAVQDTEQRLWTDESEQPDGYSFFNGDTKTEHAAVDPDFTKTRYIQNMTDKGGLLGFDFTALTAELDGIGLPDYLSVDVNRIVPAVDESLYLYTGGKGKTVTDFDSSVHVEHELKYGAGAKMVAPDGLLWVKSGEHDILIVDEDSGNDYGERKYALVIDPQTMSLEEEKGYLLAQAGGSKNPRQVEGVSAIGGTFSSATTSEFSGSWDVTPLVATKQDGSFYSKAELVGTKLAEISQMHDTDELTLIGVVQHNSESGGQVAQFDADKGGQIFQFSLDLSPHEESSLSADLGSVSPVYNPGRGIDLDANGYSLGSNVMVLDPRSNLSRLQALPSNLTLDLQASSEVRVLDPVGSLTIDAGTKGLFKLSNEQDVITNLGGAGNIISGGVGEDRFELNEQSEHHGLHNDFIRDYQAGLDRLVLNTDSGQLEFGADAEISELRNLSGISFRFTPDLRLAAGRLNVIAEQTSLLGAGFRLSATDALIESVQLSVEGDNQLVLDAAMLPDGLEANLSADGTQLNITPSQGDGSLDASAVHKLLGAVTVTGDSDGTLELTATDVDGLVATSTRREFVLVDLEGGSRLRPSEVRLDGNDGGSIAFIGPVAKPLQVLGGSGDDTVRLSRSLEGRTASYGFGGSDVLSAPEGGRVVGGGGSDVLIGSVSGFASLSGGAGNDTLIGGVADVMAGGSGDDLLIPLGGRNVLIGASGADRFLLADTHLPAFGGPNIVTDFVSGEDKLVFGGGLVNDSSEVSFVDQGRNTGVIVAGTEVAQLVGVSSSSLSSSDVITESASLVSPLMARYSELDALHNELAGSVI